jgi:hypothetical protein
MIGGDVVVANRLEARAWPDTRLGIPAKPCFAKWQSRVFHYTLLLVVFKKF